MNSSQDGIIVNEDGVLPCICVGHGNVPKVAEKIDPKILGYSRASDKAGHITNVHLKETANTIHTFTGSGHNTDQYVAEPPTDTRLVGSWTDRFGVYNPDDVCPTIMTASGGNSERKILEPTYPADTKLVKAESDRLRVYNPNDVCPTILTNHGGNSERKVLEPVACACRGRGDGQHLEASDDVANCITSVQKDSMVLEPAILTRQRSELGKELRKKGIENFATKEYAARQDGLCNTITSVQKDNYLQEPMISAYPRKRFGELRFSDVSPTLQSSDYKSPHLVGEPIPNERLVKTMDKLDVSDKDCAVMDSYNQKVEYEISPTITTRVDASNHIRQVEKASEIQLSEMDNVVLVDDEGKGYLVKDGWIWRIRKLTEREIYRLQDVDESDIDKLLSCGISKSKHYSLAGNSITVSPLFHIFRKLFIDKGNESKQLTIFDI